MKKLDLVKMNMYERCELWLNENSSVFTGFVPLKEQIDLFHQQYPQLRACIQRQGKPLKGYTEARADRKLGIASRLEPICHKALSWARINSRKELMPVWKMNAETLARLSDDRFIDSANRILDQVTEHMADEGNYRIKSDDVEALKAEVAEFTSKLAERKDLVKDKKEATREIETHMLEMDVALSNIDDLVAGQYTADEALVMQYQLRREVEAVAVRHTAIQVKMMATATGLPLEGIEIRIRELNLKALSNILGVAEISTFIPGVYHVDLIRNNTVTETRIIEFKKGRLVELEVVL